ncbi:hypothetical protein [Alteromonas phage JH01]|nr:hypothetical protein [Alteromonas phage JH01]
MSKLIYVAIVGASAGLAHTIREACINAGVEVGAKSASKVELHSFPLNVVDKIETPEVEKGVLDVEVSYRATFNTLAAQQLRKHMHRKETVEVKLLKNSTQLSYPEDEEDEEETVTPPPPPKK